MTEPVAWTAHPVDALEEGLSDLGNARRLVRLAGQNLRYVYPWARWLVWNDACWAVDRTGEVERRAKMVVESLDIEVVAEPDDARRTALRKHALASQGARDIRNMIALAQSELRVALPPEAFDRDPFLLNVQNGTLELRTGTLRAHRREDYITKLIPVAYDPEAQCPTFDAFLARIFVGRRGLVEYVQRLVGYTLTGDIREQCFFLLHGSGANGKTTLMQTVSDLLADYAATLAAETLLARKGDASLAMNDLATLQGVRFAGAVESDMGRRMAEALVKTITGGEHLKVKRLYADVFTIQPTFKLWVGTNHKPVIRGTDHAIWRRVRLIPFNVVIPDAEQDHQLLEKLQAERPGILRWAVEGCRAWQRNGLGTPEDVQRATAAYRGEMDVLGGFFAEHCVFAPEAHVASADLYTRYRAWAEAAGEKPLRQAELADPLTERGCAAKKINGLRSWIGLRLCEPHDDVDASDPWTHVDADSSKVPLGASREEVSGNGVQTCPTSTSTSAEPWEALDMFTPPAAPTEPRQKGCRKHPVTSRPECPHCVQSHTP